MEFTQILYIIGVIIGMILLTYFINKLSLFKSKAEKAEEERLEASMEDNMIYDPETGTKITLEQAESGQWIPDNDFDRLKEIEKLTDEVKKNLRLVTNEMRTNNDFKPSELSNEQLDFLDGSELLNSYDDWSYSSVFQFSKGLVIMICIEEEGEYSYHSEDYYETQIFYWLDIKDCKGHYVFTEKSFAEKIFDRFKVDDEIVVDHYECHTIESSPYPQSVIDIMSCFSRNKGFVIEVDRNYLLFKSRRAACLEDFETMKSITNCISRKA